MGSCCSSSQDHQLPPVPLTNYNMAYYPTTCTGIDLFNCPHLSRIKQSMRLYNKYKNDIDVDDNHDIMENMDISQILNDYLHLMHQHNENKQFEFIFNTLDHCDIRKCVAFRCNNKNIKRTTSIVYYSILDKIHCYYQHCFDIGNKLLIKEQMLINNDNDQDQDSKTDQYLINKKLTKLNKLLSTKRKIYNDFMNILCRTNRYNQLVSDRQNNQIYSFGFPFNYGYEGEEQENFMSLYPITVRAKYCSLKEELTTNSISVISIEQFIREYEKCKIHYNSDHCKQTFWSHKDEENKDILSVEYLLSIMIYCNHTTLQFEFSKTYRKDNEWKHDEYYYLGKYLKICVHKFGTSVIDGNIKAFYHGISQQLIFEEYIGDWTGSLHINCPLSTSSCFEVAMNFTNNNNGLIIEFDGGGILQEIKYFSVSWLSDYANESEYLFIQNAYNYSSLKINNIFDVKLGFEYGIILKSLRNINAIVNKGNLYMSEDVEDLTKQIIHSQLLLNHQSYDCFNQYSSNIMKTYFNNKTYIYINYEKLKNYNIPWLLDLLFLKESDCIKLEFINGLFPNIETIVLIMRNINLCSFKLDNILCHLNGKNGETKLKEIQLCYPRGNKVKYIFNGYVDYEYWIPFVLWQ